MNGRLGMTGNSVERGDSAVYKGLMSALRGKPKIIPLLERPIPKFAVKGGWRDARLDAREEAASDRGQFRTSLSKRVISEQAWRRAASGYLRRTKPKVYSQKSVNKVDTTMDEHEAGKLAGKYDTRGPLPKGMDRATKMKAYEARYIASGGKKGEKWKRHADMAERGRNIGLAGATTSAAAILALRGKHTGPALRKIKITPHRAEAAGLGSAVAGGTSELYGEHARHRRASYQNSPAGVAGSALTRMQNYTPGVKR